MTETKNEYEKLNEISQEILDGDKAVKTPFVNIDNKLYDIIINVDYTAPKENLNVPENRKGFSFSYPVRISLYAPGKNELITEKVRYVVPHLSTHKQRVDLLAESLYKFLSVDNKNLVDSIVDNTQILVLLKDDVQYHQK